MTTTNLVVDGSIYCTNITNPFVVGPTSNGAYTTTLEFTDPFLTNNVITFPDTLGNDTVATLDSAQTFTRDNTFAGTVNVTSVSDQLVFGPGATSTTFDVTTPAASIVIRVDDPRVDCYMQLGILGITSVNASYNVPVLATGDVFAVTPGAAAITLTLPVPVTGLRYKFIMVGPGAGATTTVSTNGLVASMYGLIIGIVAVTNKAASTVVIGSAVANNLIIGDSLEVTYTGTIWQFTAHSGGAAAGWS